MLNHRLSLLSALFVASGLAACDRDPTTLPEQFSVSCPTGVQDINSPILLSLSAPVFAPSVSPGNVVVTSDSTGIEIPGTVILSPTNNTQLIFTPSGPFRFGQRIRVRVQNLLSARTETQIPVTLCELQTQAAPIQEIVWNRLPNAGGGRLVGGTVFAPGTGVVMSVAGVVFRRSGAGDFAVTYQNPYYNAGTDLAFVDQMHGFATFSNGRIGQRVLAETFNQATSFDSTVIVSESLNRLYFRGVPNPTPGVFGVVGGGYPGHGTILKYFPASRTLTTTLTDASTGGTVDIDFGADTVNGAAVTGGLHVGSFDVRGKLYVTSNGGATWTFVPGSAATSQVQLYAGVGMRRNGDIFVTGGAGYAARYSSTGGGSYTATPFLQGVVATPDTTDPTSLVFTDVQFAPDNDQVGWIIGARLTGLVAGTPSYEGLIFQTRDGGASWIRQGVRGAANYGGQFPRLNRILVQSSTVVWLVGDEGTVLEYQP